MLLRQGRWWRWRSSGEASGTGSGSEEATGAGSVQVQVPREHRLAPRLKSRRQEVEWEDRGRQSWVSPLERGGCRRRGGLTGERGRLGLSNKSKCRLLDRVRLGHRNSRSRLGLADIILNGIFLEELEDVVEHKVAIELFRKEECLDKLSLGVAVVGHFADDLDNDTTIGGGLRVYRVNEDFAVLETDEGDLFVDFLNGWYA